MSQTRRSQKCALIRASTIARLVGEPTLPRKRRAPARLEVCFKNLELCLIVVTISSFNQESLQLGVGAQAFLIKALIDSTDDKISSLVIDPS